MKKSSKSSTLPLKSALLGIVLRNTETGENQHFYIHENKTIIKKNLVAVYYSRLGNNPRKSGKI